ncbi:MAG: carboxypeptidase-like regulatory domain-containing protein, partial [Terriglobales bacterium]
MDATGALVPNAKVVILDLATNNPRETKTNAQGEYRVFGLSMGKYQVSISLAGMRTTQITGIEINGSDTVRADAQLKVASASETVDVSAEAPLVNSSDQTISDTIGSRAVIDLPRDSRDVYSFLYLNPNITQGSDAGEFKFLGAQSYGGNITLDGQRSNGGIAGSPTDSKPSLEAVADINVLSNDFSAEYAGISNIRVTTKRGGAGYHGSVFYNNENSALAAWTSQDIIGKEEFAPYPGQSSYPNPYFNLTDIGGSFGGPIPKLRKTWFFASYERNWNRSPVQVSSSTLPHPTFWKGDFSLLSDKNKPVVPAGVDPATLDTTVYCDDPADPTTCSTRIVQIPSGLLNPTTQALINTYFPKIGVGAPINSRGRIPLYHTILPGRSVIDTGTLRVDHDFSDKDRVYVVYTGSGATIANQSVVGAYPGLGLKQQERRNNTVSISYNRVFNTNVINEARGGFNRERKYIHSNTTLGGFLSSIGFDQSDIDAYGAVTQPGELATFGHPAVSFSNAYATFANGNRDTDRSEDQNLATFGDTLTWVIRKHSLKMGADFVKNSAVDGFAKNRQNVRGLVTYGGTGANTFVPFLLGLGSSSVSYVNLPRPNPMDVYNWETGYFFQDDWKVSPRLTLNLGIRYEVITPFIDNNDMLINFDPKFVDPATGLKGRFIVPSAKTLPFLDTRIADTRPIVTAS